MVVITRVDAHFATTLRWALMPSAEPTEPEAGRYVVYGEIASGGMAIVEYGRRVGSLGFARPVAIKRPHAQFLKDPTFVSMFVDEARLSARLHHANIVSTLDLVEDKGQLGLVMEYVHGETLERLLELSLARGERAPVPIATALVTAVLHGLHFAHETRDEKGEPLAIVHRDVSPQNILVGEDGAPRVLDFGIAKGMGRLTATPTGHIKGKLLYMAPEQLRALPIDRRADIYAASAVLWETLVGQALFEAASESAVIQAVLELPVKAPSTLRAEVPTALDHIVLRGLARNPSLRFETAREMALALERDVGIATQSEVSAWVQHLAGERLVARTRKLQSMQAEAEAGQAARYVEAAHTQRLDTPVQAIAESVQRPIGQVTTDETPPRTAFGGLRGLALAAGVVLVALALWAISRITEPTPLPPTATVIERHEDPAPAPITTLRPGAEAPIAPLPKPVAPVVEEPPLEAERIEPPSPAPVAPHARTTKPRKPEAAARAASTSAPKPNCAQPYVIDADGIKHPRPECL
jgi:serine/threonine-protein kinase